MLDETLMFGETKNRRTEETRYQAEDDGVPSPYIDVYGIALYFCDPDDDSEYTLQE